MSPGTSAPACVFEDGDCWSGRPHSVIAGKFPENEETVRRLAATDSSFDALCHEYREVMELLHGFEVQVTRLSQRRAWLEEELLTRIEGHQPR